MNNGDLVRYLREFQITLEALTEIIAEEGLGIHSGESLENVLERILTLAKAMMEVKDYED